MRVLLIGSGGREHALGWKLAHSPHLTELISLPGNPGLAEIGSVVEGVEPNDVGAVAALARVHRIDLVVVGPEEPLARGVVDTVAGLGIPVFGPPRGAARLESSKAFAKDVMARAGVPTARSWTFHDGSEAHSHLDRHPGPYVVKADGLAAGKGVLVSPDPDEAHAWIDYCLGGGFGAAGETVVIEEHLAGPEISVFALCAGNEAVALEPARDYKRLSDDDLGPNTGGMGSYSPVADLPDGLAPWTMDTVIRPTLEQLAADGTPYTGFLYVGLVLTAEGPQVLEFNVRLGDPETQVILPRLRSDLLELLAEAASGRLSPPAWSEEAAVEVVLAAPGYPQAPVKGAVISGLRSLDDDILVFHAGTSLTDGDLVVDGGRVLDLVAVADTIEDARRRVYEAAAQVSWPGVQYRTDIAKL